MYKYGRVICMPNELYYPNDDESKQESNMLWIVRRWNGLRGAAC